MIAVEEADRIIFSHLKDFGKERITFGDALGRVLAEDLLADRDLPPYNRVSMDGIAIRYNVFEKGIRSFTIMATQAAGDTPREITEEEQCIEIMTGAALPPTTDTVIRYEDVLISNGRAVIQVENVLRGQNIHVQGSDKASGATLAAANQKITPALISLAASVGASSLVVKKRPEIVVISTGDELVRVHETPTPYQIRQSNNHTIRAALQQHAFQADLLHIPDNPSVIHQQLQRCLQAYQVIILSGGISMGKFDYIPQTLEDLSVNKHFHKVKQRPGKPFWFGTHAAGAVVFALPGNPVSTFMCLHRYVLPWLQAASCIKARPLYAMLEEPVSFTPDLQYFLQVQLNSSNKGTIVATAVAGNGSGDFSSLLQADAFMELPAHQSTFSAGDVYRVWPFVPGLF
ncbi:molybdenum cofactor synthesis domain protein [Flammeovirgaceae bacterium 311]|nr:molybdenum cofactor synthesis domain protein [Flammeovirgaceae bacterium 311]